MSNLIMNQRAYYCPYFNCGNIATICTVCKNELIICTCVNKLNNTKGICTKHLNCYNCDYDDCENIATHCFVCKLEFSACNCECGESSFCSICIDHIDGVICCDHRIILPITMYCNYCYLLSFDCECINKCKETDLNCDQCVVIKRSQMCVNCSEDNVTIYKCNNCEIFNCRNCYCISDDEWNDQLRNRTFTFVCSKCSKNDCNVQ